MLATVRSHGATDSSIATLQGESASAGGFISFVSSEYDRVRARRSQCDLPAAMHCIEARRLGLDEDEDYRQVLGDNPALLTGLLPQEAPHVLTLAYELGSDNYIG
jgi:hypothetical protein